MNDIKKYKQITDEILEESSGTLQESIPMSVVEYVSVFGVFPYEAVLLGVSDDGLPVLMNVKSDENLNTIIQNGSPILNTVSEFYRQTQSSLYEVVWLSDNLDTAGQQLLALASYSHVNNRRKNVILLIPDIEQIFHQDFDEKMNFRWILNHGRFHGVFIIASYKDRLSDTSILRDSLFNIHVLQCNRGYIIPCRGQKETKLFPLG